MHPHLSPMFTATSNGILIDGLLLNKSASQSLPPQALYYVKRAEKLLAKVKKEDWDNRTPHARDDIPALAKAQMMLALASPQSFGKYSPDQPRMPAGNSDGGQFTSAGNSEGITDADRENPRFKGMTDTQIKKQKFVDANLNATDQVAQRLNVPVANILGLSAVESGWGLGSFILDGPTVADSTNAYFGMHAPAPFMDGTTPIGNGPGAMAGFTSYQDALNSFAAKYGSMIQGVSDPTQFAT